jgi:hypothetical protein
MITVKADISRATAGEIKDKLTLTATKLTGNGSFPSPPTAPAALTAQATLITSKLAAITAHEFQGQQLTIELRNLRNSATDMINQNASYVQTTANQLSGTDASRAAAVVSAGYTVVEAPAPVGPLPKVENLKVTQGDADATLDAGWDPIVRGLQTFIVQFTVDPAALTGWQQAGLTKKSTLTLTGLTSGQRYWIRVCAVGAAGNGPWSDPATKVAP